MAKKYLLIIFGFLLLSTVIFIYVYRFISINPETKTELAAPTPMPLVLQEASTSAYATDSAILKIETELQELKAQLETTDLDEASLQPPVLDLQVEY